MKAFNSIEEYRKIQKKRKRVKIIVSITLLILLAAGVGVLLYQSGVLENGIFSFFSNGGEHFPVKLAGEQTITMDAMSDDTLVLLTERQVYFYKKSGKLIRSAAHGMNHPVMRINGRRVLIYDLGGDQFRVEEKNETVVKKTDLGQKLLLCDIAADGKIAAVTESVKYSNELTVYEANATKKTYKWDTPDKQITALCFYKNAKGCVAAGISAENGVMKTTVYGLDFRKKTETFSTELDEPTPLEIAFLHDDIHLIGLEQSTVLSEKGKVLGTYSNDAVPADIKENYNGKTLALFADEIHKSTVSVLLDGGAKAAARAETPGEILDAETAGGRLFLLTYKKIYCYDKDLKLVDEIDCGSDVKSIAPIGQSIYCLGASEINCIAWQEPKES